MMHRIALIHAVSVAMPPIEAAFDAAWPEAVRMNLLDDSLLVDRSRMPELSPAFHERMTSLVAYAASTGCTGILFTCSAFGPAIETAARTFNGPVLKPNEAMFEAALPRGNYIGMLASFAPSVASMEAEFADMARERGSTARIHTICVPEAMTALRAGDGATHDRLLAEAAGQLRDCDVVMLAQFSTARAQFAVQRVLSAAVLTSPAAAVAKLKTALGA